MSTVTEQCIPDDVADPAHDRCAGAVYANRLDEGQPCECPCHSLPRCEDAYIADHGSGVYDCLLHIGHGGAFHRHRFVLWSRAVTPSEYRVENHEAPPPE